MGHDYPLNGEFLMGYEDSQSTFLTFSQHFYGPWNVFCAWGPFLESPGSLTGPESYF